MIRFRYEPVTVKGTRGTRFETVYRPVIPIRLYGPAGDEELTGLVDTGADDTLLPDRLVKLLEIALPSGDHAIIVGIEGSMTVVRFGLVDLSLLGSGNGYRWSARVGFHPGSRIVFGHNGFLEYFTASFNGRGRHLSLTPNGNAPAPAYP